MKKIIDPIDRKLIEAELTDDKFLRQTSFGSNLLYTVNHHNSPYIMQEIGRLREVVFRNAGGGTGQEVDIDSYDVSAQNYYEQLIVWDPQTKEILGGYRYILGSNARDEQGNLHFATQSLFDFNQEFIDTYIPHLIELGRSFVHHDYQSGKHGRKGIFALDNLWEGIGAVMALNPDVQYLFGKVTMYLHYDKTARDYILYFFKKHFGDTNNLVIPKAPLPLHGAEKDIAAAFTGTNSAEDYKILFTKVRELKQNIPPLISSYVNLCSTMKSFGTVLNQSFGNVEETGILVALSDILPEKLERYVYSFAK